jgi:hypothetical protein
MPSHKAISEDFLTGCKGTAVTDMNMLRLWNDERGYKRAFAGKQSAKTKKRQPIRASAF